MRRRNPESDEARELELFIDNDSALYRQQHTPILKNLATKKARGIYVHSKAVKLFMYLVESGAKKYAREFGSPGVPWHVMFPVPVRKQVAEDLTNSFETEYDLGNYDNLLPKKYQGTRRNPTAAIPRTWIPARVRRLKSGQVQVAVGGRR